MGCSLLAQGLPVRFTHMSHKWWSWFSRIITVNVTKTRFNGWEMRPRLNCFHKSHVLTSFSYTSGQHCKDERVQWEQKWSVATRWTETHWTWLFVVSLYCFSLLSAINSNFPLVQLLSTTVKHVTASVLKIYHDLVLCAIIMQTWAVSY